MAEPDQSFRQHRRRLGKCRPYTTNLKTIPKPPAPRYTDIRHSAGSLAELNIDELKRRVLPSTDHNNTMQQLEKIRDKLGDVHVEIIYTVRKENQRYLTGPAGPRNAILRLAGALAPRETQQTHRPRDVISRWHKLQRVTPNDNLDGWLARWHFLYNEGEAAGITEMDGKRTESGLY